MEEQPDPATWVLLAVPLAGLLAVTMLRWVPTGHLMVVTRRGVVARVSRPGLALRTPTTETVLVPSGEHEVSLAVRATTRDGTPVRLLVTARAERVPPAPLQRYVDPVVTAVPAAEQVLARAVAAGDVHDLPDRLRRTWPRLCAQADRETTPRGLRIRSLEIVELDAVLMTDADATGHRGPR